MELLRVLIKNHGLKRFMRKGFPKEDLPAYREKIACPERLGSQSDRQTEKPVAGSPRGAGRQALPRSQISRSENSRPCWLTSGCRLIEMGAAGRLLDNGEIEEVLPIEDAEALETANPITPDNKLRLEQAKITAPP